MSSLQSRSQNNRNAIPEGSRQEYRDNRYDETFEEFCARETRTVAASDEPGGYVCRTRKAVAPIARWTNAQAQAIVSEDMKHLAKLKNPTPVPDDPRDRGFKEAIALRMLQNVAKSRIASQVTA